MLKISAVHFHQLLSAVAKCVSYRLIWNTFDWNFYVHTKVDACAKFQLSRLIFIFINCYQLSTAVNSWYKKKYDWYFHVDTTVDMYAKFELSRLIFIFISCYPLLTADDNYYKKNQILPSSELSSSQLKTKSTISLKPLDIDLKNSKG